MWHFNSGAAGRTSYAVRGTSVDILLAPSAEDEAPAGLVATGDPISNRMWTLLANPCVHVPLRTGASGMPLGVTLIGPRWADARTLTAAHLPETLRPIEVVSRTNEEGCRFGPGAMGSTACQDATGSSRQKCFVLLEGDSRR